MGRLSSDKVRAAVRMQDEFSVSELERYATCPYRWFLDRAVRPRELDVAFEAREAGSVAHEALAAFYQRWAGPDAPRRVVPDDLPEALRIADEVLDAAFESAPETVGLAEELAAERVRRWVAGVIADDAYLMPGYTPVSHEFAFGRAEGRPFELAGVALKGRIDRIDACDRGLIVTDYKSAGTVPGHASFAGRAVIQLPVYLSAAVIFAGRRGSRSDLPLAQFTEDSRLLARRPSLTARVRRTIGRGRCRRSRVDTRRGGGESSYGRCRYPRRRHRTCRGGMRCLRHMHREGDVQGGALRMTFPLNEGQERAAGTLEGPVLISAGAGTGKTRVLTERFVRAVVPDGADGWTPAAVDELLTITFTEKAAGELVERIRSSLRSAGLTREARQLDGAWISTIHGFCARILRRHALEAGLDPGFVVADETEAREMREEAFEEAARSLHSSSNAVRELFALYGFQPVWDAVARIARMLDTYGLTAADIALEPAPDIDGLLAEALEFFGDAHGLLEQHACDIKGAANHTVCMPHVARRSRRPRCDRDEPGRGRRTPLACTGRVLGERRLGSTDQETCVKR
jgi:hypothetical protein